MSTRASVVKVAEMGIDLDRWRRLADHSRAHMDVRDRISDALTCNYGAVSASEIGFHCSDWVGDAIDLVAMHLRPDLFDDEEVRTIVERLAIHASAHVMALTKLQENPLNDTWNLGLEIKAGQE